ncbi:hypothetical protein GOBAR_AA04286 [Gossypium barbadense]|uniref:Uncharacterized protein n=1 Tax=Gossypium barbadense TaxID=3634 RepID=A0A2P5YL44_GOSBA|nr:hypothetical protein GOBAR_AA04286 [Gossypium barbadense]
MPLPFKMRNGELTFRVGDETITLQARNLSNTSKIKGGCINHSTKTDHVVQPTLQEISSENLHEPCSSNNKGPIYEERRLQIEELDKWRIQKPRTPNKLKSSQDELNTSPNQLKVGDTVLLDATDPRITTSKPNEEIPLTVLSIFPYGTVEVIHPKFETFKVNNTRLKPYTDKVDSRDEKWFSHPHSQAHGCALGRAHTTGGDTAVRYTMSSSIGKKTAVPASKKRKGVASSSGPTAKIRHPFLEFPLEPQHSSTFHLQVVMTNLDDPGMVQFHLSGLVRQLSVPEFGIALGLYTEEFMDGNKLDTLYRHIHYSPSKYWKDLIPASASYDPSRSKASALAPSLRYLHAILAHTLTG